MRIESTPRFANFDQDDIDVAIRVGDGRWPGLKSTELFAIAGMPVATRSFVTAQRIRKPDDLVNTRLIHDAAQPRAWRVWLAAQDAGERDESGDLWFDSAPATLQAAEQNLGVALGIDPLVRLWPGFGERLRQTFPGASGPRTRYWIVRRHEFDADPKIKAFIAWVRAACRALEVKEVAAGI